jgi:hypothetical protein
MPEKYVCIHGHFYQPPRENPWLEEVELQDFAYPYHDWNERITAECYAPNTASRILDPDRRIHYGIYSGMNKEKFRTLSSAPYLRESKFLFEKCTRKTIQL